MDNIKITHLKDEFLAFYNQAITSKADPDERFELWRQLYGFSVTQLGNHDDQLTRDMLDHAFPQYAFAVDRIEHFEPNAEEISTMLTAVKEELNYFPPVHMSIVFFVGNFESDPFLQTDELDHITLYYPIEKDLRQLDLAKELARAVYCLKLGDSSPFAKSVAHITLQEGIALHTAEKVNTSFALSAPSYSWMNVCNQEPNRIMINLLPHIKRNDYEALYSFTKGRGASGFFNEAIFVGWVTVKHLLDKGRALSELAAIPEEEVTALLEQTLYNVLDTAYFAKP
ncbi:hypothetical protein MUO14_20165 [Halobacillus shinanisalinarum]|uniref:Uncharacterized protein n=1 Tax=Halobacillus shinanisalinarum TaxID=2932258 RepID=A0ABY4GXC0_9BACI|nr:hypothetical protein [Halobacillus shinanisalinarum]UOQ92709.1 hypothetical protein MUO14_20165 [Halobacillus shinanisalinarum]